MQYAYALLKLPRIGGKSRCDFIYCNYEHSLLSIHTPPASHFLSFSLFNFRALGLVVLISFTLPNQQTYWSALVRFASVRSTQRCSFGGKIRKSTVSMFRNDFCSPIKRKRGEKVKRVINLIKFQMRNATSKIRTRETETNRMEKVAEQQCTRNMCFLCCVEIKNCKLQSQCKYCCV